ncbi:hypothetical protein IL308_10875 [Lactococcus lactis]|uniref:hypothetical protein n=1 Tax=Lactococcus lactis TaxID=1358 RepID=UPI0019135899|nr:hypothetical protein [Lactococcus lactis]MBK5077256.1 hypothetical protein [Lactococcus lactis]WDA67420.1 hypothetical protein IL310_00720 [Lactococcus lactis]
MAYVKVRLIPDDELLVLDELAAENGMTRESFLRQKIHEIVRHELRIEQEEKFKQIVEKATNQITKTEQAIQQLLEHYYEN